MLPGMSWDVLRHNRGNSSSMKLPMIRGAIALFVWPSYARRVSRLHHDHLNEESRRQDAARASGTRPADEPWPDRQIAILRRSWLSALGIVGTVLLLGGISGVLLDRYLGPGGPYQVSLQLVGAGLLLWSTLGMGGYSIQTMDGGTFAEQLDHWVFRVIHVLGTFILMAATTWASR